MVLEDIPDNRILECAFEAAANLIVTGDRHLLQLKTFQSERGKAGDNEDHQCNDAGTPLRFSNQYSSVVVEAVAASKNPGSVNSGCVRGRDRVGASRAACNSDHFAVLSSKVRPSVSTSSARDRALSLTKSLSERRETEAVASSVRLYEKLSRRPSFSLQTARAGISSPLVVCNNRSIITDTPN